jgi:hypothetical protein
MRKTPESVFPPKRNLFTQKIIIVGSRADLLNRRFAENDCVITFGHSEPNYADYFIVERGYAISERFSRRLNLCRSVRARKALEEE